MTLAFILILVTQFILWCGIYLIWPSRWNIPGHIYFGLFVASGLIPLFGFNVLDNYSETLLLQFAMISLTGAVAYLLGQFWGARSKGLRFLEMPRTVTDSTDDELTERAFWPILLVLSACTVGLAYYFYVLGVPAFADNVAAARFQREEFDTDSIVLKTIFRLSFHGLVPTIAIGMVMACSRGLPGDRRLLMGCAVTAASMAVVLTLVRWQFGATIITVVGVGILPWRRTFIPYLAIVIATVAFGAGSVVWLHKLNTTGVAGGLADAVGTGAPDVEDSLDFLDNFNGESFTFGRTFLGGIVPNRYEWNPCIWSMRVRYQIYDESQFWSGGLRLTSALWGYTAFGYIGAFFVPLLTGLIIGCSTHSLASSLDPDTPLRNIWLYQWFAYVITAISQFYYFGYFAILQLGTLLLITLWIGRSKEHQANTVNIADETALAVGGWRSGQRR